MYDKERRFGVMLTPFTSKMYLTRENLIYAQVESVK